jgi:hypothetical protein
MERFSKPNTLPFQLAALPDEILGSWLGRLARSNGLQSKEALLRWLGVPKPLRRIVLGDVVSIVDSTNHIFSALDVAHLDVLSQLSTRPYWESMHAWRDVSDQTGEVDPQGNPVLSTWAGRPIAGKFLSETYLKICPACLVEDLQVAGASYFHRSHQLMGTRVCHKHGIYLLRSCPNCMMPLGDTRGLLNASLHCRCGAELTTERHCVDEHDPWWSLAIFEHRCLQAGNGCLARRGLISYLRERVRAKFPAPGKFGGRKALEQTFGKEGADWVLRPLRGQSASALTDVTPTFSLTAAMAPTYTALFVACDISFEKALGEVNSYQLSQHGRSTSSWTRTAPPTTCKEARSQFTKFISTGGEKRWKTIYATRSHVYWLLTLKDKEWIDKQMPPRAKAYQAPFPSIDFDRKLLTDAGSLTISSKQPQKVRHASIRALYRDEVWLQSYLESHRNQIKDEARETFISRLRQVRSDHERRTLKPTRFTRRHASQGLGISVKSLLSQASKFNLPCEVVEEHLSVFRRRALKWAVEQRLAQGLSLAPSMVRELAGINALVNTSEVARIIKEILEERQSEPDLYSNPLLCNNQGTSD